MSKPPRKPTRKSGLIRASDVKAEELAFLWEERIPRGTLTLIGGRPGQGKSLFSVLVAAHVTNGGSSVIMSNPEDSKSVIRTRLDAAGADTRLVHLWPGKLMLPADVEQLEADVLFYKATLVTVDPIAKHVGGRDPNTALEPLVAMAERTGCAVLGVHHLNKRIPRDAAPADAFGGANGGWLGTARFAYVFGPVDSAEPEARFLASAKSNYAPGDVPSVEFYVESQEVALHDGTITEAGKLVQVSTSSPVDGFDVVKFSGGQGGKHDGSNPEKKAVASEFLTLLLMNGPKPATEVFEKAAEASVSKMTMRRAATELEIVKKRVGFGPGSYLTWELPAGHPALPAPIVPEASESVQMDVDAVISEILKDEAEGDA